MGTPRAYFVHSDEIEQYHYPPDCPFKTERASLTRRVLSDVGLWTGSTIAPRRASREQLETFHTPQYLTTLEEAARGHLDADGLFMGLGTAETPVFAGLYDYACLAAGGTLLAAQLVLDGTADVVFNPSGGYHHALRDTAGGFCYVNDIVLACRALADAGKRVMCVDIDAHHGNGQQAAFYGSPDVLTVSTHEDGKTLYPWGGFVEETGEGRGLGYNVNIPLPPGTDDEAFMYAFRAVVPPLMRAFAPDILVLEVGMDILATDPLTHLGMTNNAVAEVLPLVMQPGVPIVATGGGGYQPDNTARGWALAWTVLCGVESETDAHIGLGGIFLGTSEWNAGLRDMRSYRQGPEKAAILDQLGETTAYITRNVFPHHGLRP
jgi:acetoin utilization protein AcuC